MESKIEYISNQLFKRKSLMYITFSCLLVVGVARLFLSTYLAGYTLVLGAILAIIALYFKNVLLAIFADWAIILSSIFQAILFIVIQHEHTGLWESVEIAGINIVIAILILKRAKLYKELSDLLLAPGGVSDEKK